MQKASRVCSVRTCSNNDLTHRMYSFPPEKQHERLLLWKAACGDTTIFYKRTKHRYMCGSHFESRFLGHWFLRRDAIPTLNLPTPAKIPDALSQCINYEDVTKNDVTFTLDEKQPEYHSKISYSNIEDINENLSNLQTTRLITVTEDVIDKPTIKKGRQPLHVSNRRDDAQNNDAGPLCTSFGEVDYDEENDYMADDPPELSSNVIMDIKLQVEYIEKDTTHLPNKPAETSHENVTKKPPTRRTTYPKVLKLTKPSKSYGKTDMSRYSHESAAPHDDPESCTSVVVGDRENRRPVKEFLNNFTVNDDIFSDDDSILSDNEEADDPSLMCHDYCTPDINTVCRLCGNRQRDVDLLIDIFDEKTQLHQKISKCFHNMKIIMDEALPRNACKTCVKFVKQMHSYMLLVKRVDKHLKASYRADGDDQVVMLSEDQKDLIPVRKEQDDNNSNFLNSFDSSHNANKLTLKFLIMRQSNYTFGCPFCKKTFKTKSLLLSHITLDHLDVNNEMDTKDNIIKQRCRKRRKSDMCQENSVPIKMEFVESTNLIAPEAGSPLVQFTADVESPAANSCLEYDDKTALNPFMKSNDCTILKSLLMDITSTPNAINRSVISLNDDQKSNNGNHSFFMLNISELVHETDVENSVSTNKIGSNDSSDIKQGNQEENYENISVETLLINKKSSNDVNKLTCGKCNKVFKNYTAKLLHEEKIHGFLGKCYECKMCLEAFASVLLLTRHSTSTHNVQLNQENVKPIRIRSLCQCEYCCRMYTNYRALLSHKSTCTSAVNKKFTCYCSETITSPKYLSKHWASHEKSSDPLLERPTCSILHICEYCYSMHRGVRTILSHVAKKHPIQVARAVIARNYDDSISISELGPGAQ